MYKSISHINQPSTFKKKSLKILTYIFFPKPFKTGETCSGMVLTFFLALATTLAFFFYFMSHFCNSLATKLNMFVKKKKLVYAFMPTMQKERGARQGCSKYLKARTRLWGNFDQQFRKKKAQKQMEISAYRGNFHKHQNK